MVPTRIDLLIRNGAVITVDANRTIFYDGALAIKAGRIVALGPTEQIAGRYVAAKTIDARHKAVLPGLIDTHHHFLQNFLKGVQEDLTGAEWIATISAPRISLAVQGYLSGDYSVQVHASRLGCVDALRSGITCLLNMEWATPPEVVDIFEAMGIRIVQTLTFTDIDQWNSPGMLLPGRVGFDLADRLIARCRRSTDGLTTFRYGLACPNSCSAAQIQEVRALATQHGVGIHIHLAESKFEWDNIHNLHGTTPTRYVYELGLLGRDVLAAHSIWLSDEDIALLKETGTAVAHCPESNMRGACGVAPITKMLRAGVVVSLGTDTCAGNDNMDMFEAMRAAASLQKVHLMDPAAVLATEMLEAATIGGARALGVSDQIGSLEVGKKADVILVDLQGAHLRPINNIVNNWSTAPVRPAMWKP